MKLLTWIAILKHRNLEMPVKGTTLKNGPRHNFLNRDLWKRFTDATGRSIPYDQFIKIVTLSSELIGERIGNNISGFKFPESMGYSVVTRYKPKRTQRNIDWKKTKELGTKVYHTNFHSFGYMPRIVWLTNRLSTCKFIDIYKFTAGRKLSRLVSTNMKSGKIYNEYSYDHFRARKIKINIDRLDKDGRK